MSGRIFYLPRRFFILLMVLIVASLFFGFLHLFYPAKAQAIASPTPVIVLTQTPTVTEFDPLDTPPTEIPSLPPGIQSADTTGIIAMAILLVVIVILGTFWGWRLSVPPTIKQKK